VCRIYLIKEGGWTVIHYALDVNQLHYLFSKEKGEVCLLVIVLNKECLRIEMK